MCGVVRRGRLSGAGRGRAKLPSLVAPAHQIGYLATKWSEGKPLCIFVKYFTKILKVKYFTTFYKGFFGQQKIFYLFDYILHANKYVKIGKHFKIYILFQNKEGINCKFLLLTFCISF